MTNTWDSLLTDASVDAAQVLTCNQFSPLPGFALLRASGADAAEFLHSQLTNDVKALPENGSTLAAYCTPKGRALALLRLLRTAEGFELILPAEIAESLHKRLRMFILRSKVKLEAPEDMHVAGVSGPDVQSLLASKLGEVPTGGGSAMHADIRVVHLPGEQLRYLLIGPATALAAFWESSRDQLQKGSQENWRLLDIRAGIPQVFAATQETFVPQMINLDLIGGLSYQKGCYPGQEIVARMHYLGTLKRRMYRIAFDSNEAPEPGTRIRDAEDKRVGELVMAAPGPNGYEGLAVLAIEQAEAEGLLLEDIPISVTPPPYPL